MINEVILKRSIFVVLSTTLFTGTEVAYAFDMCKDMFGKMNQSEWRGDYRDRNYYSGAPMVESDYGYRGRDHGYGYGGPPVHSYGYRSEWSESALGILDKRYAKGEIDKQEYEDKKDTITSSR